METNFEFYQNSILQTRALKTLKKLIRTNDKVIPIYEWIEQMEDNLEVKEVKIYSHKGKEGWTLKKVIGDHIVSTKAEQDYYVYLHNGGTRYSDYIKAEETRIKEQQELENAERQKEQEERTREARKQFTKDEEKKYMLIKSVLSGETTLEGLISLFTKSDKQYLAYLKTLRQTNDIKETEESTERNIDAKTTRAKAMFDTITNLYVIVDGSVAQKYEYKKGDPVWVNFGRGPKVATFYKDIRTNADGSITYIVEQAEGVVNPYIDYEFLTPRTI